MRRSNDQGESSRPDGPVRLFHAGDPKSHQFRAIAFDLDAASIISLKEALPGWEIEVINGATAASLSSNWRLATTDLLVVAVNGETKRPLALCQFLLSCSRKSSDCQEEIAIAAGLNRDQQEQARRADMPMLVLVHPGQEHLVSAALEAGAESCLVLPIHAKDVPSILARAREGNQPGRHTRNLERAQVEDHWRDEGGQG
jgi:PleD family two-component response regulator